MMNQELLIALESGSEALAKVNSLDSLTAAHTQKRVQRNDALLIFLFLSEVPEHSLH